MLGWLTPLIFSLCFKKWRFYKKSEGFKIKIEYLKNLFWKIDKKKFVFDAQTI